MFRTRTRARTVSAVAACAAVLGLALAAPTAQAAPDRAGAHAAHAAPTAHVAPLPRTTPSAPASGARDTEPVQERERHTAPEIHHFLTWFYGEHGPTPRQRERNVSAFLKSKQAQNPDHDVILCAQNTPRSLAVGPVTVAQSAGFGWAPVTAYWADGTTSTSTAYVALDSQPIELHDVICAE